MSTESPQISVVLPVHNGASFIAASIQSLLDQSFRDFELIIMDDGSDDATEQIIRSFTDNRIVYIKSETKKGIVYQLNTGIGLARGRYIARMDADDISHPDRFRQQFTFMEKNPDVGICGACVEIISEGRERVNHGKIARMPQDDSEIKLLLFQKSPFFHPTVFFRKSLLDNGNLKYDPLFEYAEDYKLWVDIFDKTCFHNLQDPLLKYRVHHHNTSLSRQEKQQRLTTGIKQELFRRIVSSLSDDEAGVLTNVIDEKALPVNHFLRVQELVNRVVEGNNEKQLIQPQLLEQFLRLKFWLCCTGHTKFGFLAVKTYWGSNLRKPVSAWLSVKFLTKALFRR